MLKSPELLAWLQRAAGVTDEDAKKPNGLKRVHLFCSDRPFDILTNKNGSARTFDDTTPGMPVVVFEAEKCIGQNNAHYLNRVSHKTAGQWTEGAKKNGLKWLTPFTMGRAKESCRGFPNSNTERNCVYTYLHHTEAISGVHSVNAYKVDAKDYYTWWVGNEHNSNHNYVTNVKPFPVRFRLTGEDGVLFGDDNGDKSQKDNADEKKQNQYRYEVHPNEFAELVCRYTKEGQIVVDSSAGCLSMAITCLRTGRYCICIDKQAGSMIPNALERLKMAYMWYKDNGYLLHDFKQGRSMRPTNWELLGLTVFHKIQADQQRRATGAARREKAKGEQDVAKAYEANQVLVAHF